MEIASEIDRQLDAFERVAGAPDHMTATSMCMFCQGSQGYSWPHCANAMRVGPYFCATRAMVSWRS